MLINVSLRVIVDCESELQGISKLYDLFNSYLAKEHIKDVTIDEIKRAPKQEPQLKIELPNLENLETVKDEPL